MRVRSRGALLPPCFCERAVGGVGRPRSLLYIFARRSDSQTQRERLEGKNEARDGGDNAGERRRSAVVEGARRPARGALESLALGAGRGQA